MVTRVQGELLHRSLALRSSRRGTERGAPAYVQTVTIPLHHHCLLHQPSLHHLPTRVPKKYNVLRLRSHASTHHSARRAQLYVRVQAGADRRLASSGVRRQPSLILPGMRQVA